MSRDVELDRLKLEQDIAFQGKQSAWQAQDDAWKQRQSAREALDRAYHDKQAAYDQQQHAWEQLQGVRSRNGSRIDSLNSQQEAAFQNMKDAFERASSAHEAHDGASARAYADEGHRYKDDSQEAVTERRQLVQEIRDAGDRHRSTMPAFQHAKAVFDYVRAEHDRAKADHEQKQAEFKRAKAGFDRAKTAFQERLEVVRSERQQRQDDKRRLAEQAGVPHQYLDDVWVSTQPDGSVNIYFGGMGGPDGPGHGHYAMDPSGNVTYQREPSEDHGSQNFADHEERPDRFEKYNSSRSGQTKSSQTDLYFGSKGKKGGHIAVNEDGDIEHIRDDDGEVLLNKLDPKNPCS